MIVLYNFFASENTIFLDVRAIEEVENIDIKLANYSTVLSIPTNEIPDRVGEIPEDKLIGVFCSSSVRSVIIFSYLKSLGFLNVKILQGYDELMSELKPGKLYKHFL